MFLAPRILAPRLALARLVRFVRLVRFAPFVPFVAAALTALALSVGGCGGAPAATTPAALPDARKGDAGPPEAEDEHDDASPATLDAGADAPALKVDGGDASPRDASPPPLRSGPVTSQEDAVARASRAADIALDKSYAAHVKKVQIAPTHTGSWTGGIAQDVKATAAGWEIRFAHHPPAGFSHEAVVYVSPQGELVVKKASAEHANE